jgi:hypothetical protein
VLCPLIYHDLRHRIVKSCYGFTGRSRGRSKEKSNSSARRARASHRAIPWYVLLLTTRVINQSENEILNSCSKIKFLNFYLPVTTPDCFDSQRMKLLLLRSIHRYVQIYTSCPHDFPFETQFSFLIFDIVRLFYAIYKIKKDLVFIL